MRRSGVRIPLPGNLFFDLVAPAADKPRTAHTPALPTRTIAPSAAPPCVSLAGALRPLTALPLDANLPTPFPLPCSPRGTAPSTTPSPPPSSALLCTACTDTLRSRQDACVRRLYWADATDSARSALERSPSSTSTACRGGRRAPTMAQLGSRMMRLILEAEPDAPSLSSTASGALIRQRLNRKRDGWPVYPYSRLVSTY
ncbi:hypothetical protein CDCA_CDCA17G4300 [Cyanidium caldarium]|uniref:Uncharacterized protein n=1 Tax=Cyanidium caldarium TaxID=2771 RepID=A0AAV9J1S6_CYACA|nr:hypothetical protein CDCA_CDCA17G4300 [Cyanidium caldarium]